MNFRGRAQGKQAGSNGNQSAGQVQQEPPPRGFHGDGARGGGALARPRQQMWPVQGWRGVAGGAALCLAAGPWDVAGPGLEAVTSPGPWVHRLREASRIPWAGRALGTPGCRSTPAQPGPAPTQHWVRASWRVPTFAKRGPCGREWGTDTSACHGSDALAEDPVLHKVCLVQSQDGAVCLLPDPSQKPGPGGHRLPASPGGALDNQVDCEQCRDTPNSWHLGHEHHGSRHAGGRGGVAQT